MTSMTPANSPATALYQRIENERATRGWTKTEVARRAGVPRTTVERLKAGQRLPLPETVIRLAEALGIPRHEALALAGYDTPGTAASDDGAPSIRGLVDQVRAAILARCEAELAILDDCAQTLDEAERIQREHNLTVASPPPHWALAEQTIRRLAEAHGITPEQP